MINLVKTLQICHTWLKLCVHLGILRATISCLVCSPPVDLFMGTYHKNHWIADARNTPEIPSVLPSQSSSPQQLHTKHAGGLDPCRKGDSSTSLGSVPGLCHPHSIEFFLMSIQNPIGSGLCPVPLVLVLSTTERSPAPSSWPTLQISPSTAQIPSPSAPSHAQPLGSKPVTQEGAAGAPAISVPSSGLS